MAQGKEERTKTVGSLSRDLLLKDTKPLHSPDEQMKEQLSEYEDNVNLCIKENKNKFTDKFFVIVITKKEKLMSNVIRNYFFARNSCPTPDYDQIVYKYDTKKDSIELLWVVPDKKTCIYMKSHTPLIDPSQFSLLSYVLRFADGSLFKLSKSLNNEKEKTPELNNTRVK